MNTWCEFPEHLVWRIVPSGAKIWNITMNFDGLVRRLGRLLVFLPFHEFSFHEVHGEETVRRSNPGVTLA